MPLTLAQCVDKAVWNEFVCSSPQGNVFCTTPFIEALGAPFELWLLKKGEQIQAGAIVLSGEDGRPLQAPFPSTWYMGVLLAKFVGEMPAHSRVETGLAIVNELCAAFGERYTRISFCLHPRFEDLRSFSWFHYHEPERGQFTIDLRYTGWIDLTASKDFESFLATVRSTRRYDYRRALAKGLTVEVSTDIALLERLQALTFARQDLAMNPQEAKLLRAIASAALAHKFGEMRVCRDAAGEPASATLFLFHKDTGYYYVGANDPAHHHLNSGTFIFLDNVQNCMRRGLKFIDTCGINSPNRGGFKTSFNAAPQPYFIVTWNKPSA